MTESARGRSEPLNHAKAPKRGKQRVRKGGSRAYDLSMKGRQERERIKMDA